MFIIKKIQESELYLWTNKRSDDFAQFLPANLNTSLSNIQIYLLPDSTANKIQVFGRAALPKEENGQVVLDLYESQTFIVFDEQGQELPQPIVTYNNLVESVPAQLISYPYDTEGNFVEPEAFVP
jgi:hypothetical protein